MCAIPFCTPSASSCLNSEFFANARAFHPFPLRRENRRGRAISSTFTTSSRVQIGRTEYSPCNRTVATFPQVQRQTGRARARVVKFRRKPDSRAVQPLPTYPHNETRVTGRDARQEHERRVRAGLHLVVTPRVYIREPSIFTDARARAAVTDGCNLRVRAGART